MNALYSAFEAYVGLFWCDAQRAAAGDAVALQRLIFRSTESDDPIQSRVSAAAKRHVAVIAARQQESTQ